MDLTFSLTRKLGRFLKNLEGRSKALLASFDNQVQLIIKDPKSGSLLKGDLKGYYSWDWKHKGVELRICYKFIESDNHIYFVYFSTRENFYNEVKRYLK